MKVNQSLTAAITAAALVAGAGFAYAQSGTTPGAPGDLNAKGTASMKVPTTPDASAGTTMQAQPLRAQPSISTGTTMDNTPPSTMDTTLQPRADRN
ncbi:hypothetical protein [Polaromonas sp.]|uniref:hypothetical protein n=1 Tax=Polaromonas sp. TaxID=1869339 RepID=UPI00356AC5D6